MILALGWFPLLVFVRPNLTGPIVASQSLLLGLSLGLFLADMYTLALPLLFLGALAGFSIGMMVGFDGTTHSVGKQVTLASLGLVGAAVLLVVDNAYASSNVGTVTACVSSGAFSHCVTYGPYLWPYAQTLVAVLIVGGSIPLMMRLGPRFWPAGIVGAGILVGGLVWFLGINLPSDTFTVGVVAVFGALLLLGTSTVYIDQWWIARKTPSRG